MTVNALAEALAQRRFFWSLEFIPSVDRILRDDLSKLGGIAAVMRTTPILVTFAVTDRVVSERDPEPVAAASSLLDTTGKQPLVHFSGKGREMADLEHVIDRMRANDLSNMLVLTGDRVKREPVTGRVRYLESVPAIHRVRALCPEWIIAGALNPFKYCEEEGMAQYMKLEKKVGAGANLVITQIGFDPVKLREAVQVVSENRAVPLVANVLLLSAARARHMRRNQLAGITITDSLMNLLDAEAERLPDRGSARVLRRLALQIVGVELAGYAGVQITGLHAPEKVLALEEAVERAKADCPDQVTWDEAWKEAMTGSDGKVANPVPPGHGWRFGDPHRHRATLAERARFLVLDAVHAAIFDRGPIAACLGALFRPLDGREDTVAGRALHTAERAIKRPLVGCDTCGMCRLHATQYVCPETCPKGLANGPCGGTTLNRCEFGDRECIHSRKYRIAASAGIEYQLREWLIQAVPNENRHRTSWPAHFAGKGPSIVHLHRGEPGLPGPDAGQARREDRSPVPSNHIPRDA